MCLLVITISVDNTTRKIFANSMNRNESTVIKTLRVQTININVNKQKY